MATPPDANEQPKTATWRNKATGKLHTVHAKRNKSLKAAIGVRPREPEGGWSLTPIPGTIWTDFELDHMSLNLPLYRQCKGQARKSLLWWVRGQIHKKWGDRYSEVALQQKTVLKEWRRRKNVYKSIGDWFRNHGRTTTEIKIPHWRGRVTFHSVMLVKKRAQILDLTDELSGGAKRGSTDGKWIGHFQKAAAQIKAGLSEEERAEIRATQLTWDNKSLPEPEQARIAAERGGKTLQKVHDTLFQTMGMRCVTLCTYYDQAGLPVHSLVDTNDKLVRDGAGRVRSFRSWDTDNDKKVTATWADYVDNIVIPAEKPELLAEEIRKKVGAPKPAIIIKPLDNGHILVPDPHERENQADRNYIIRQFMNSEYKLAKGGNGRSAPWQAIGKDPYTFIDADCIPDGSKLCDPEKMSGADRIRILEHWRRRQALGNPALIFKAVITNGNIDIPSYPRNMTMPPVIDCAPIHIALPVPAGDTDSDGAAEMDEEDLEDFGTEHETSSSGDSETGLPTPAPTSPVPELQVAPKRKRGRPKKTVVDVSAPATLPVRTIPDSPAAPAKRRPGRPRKNVHIESEPETDTPPPQPSMPTLDGTPTPQPKAKTTSRPKPVPKKRERAILERELENLGIEIPQSSGRVLRSSPLKPTS